MAEKKLIIKFYKGFTYEIPARIIAESRADHYASVDGYEQYSQEYYDEVNYALDNEFELFDWIQNNIDWQDIKNYSQKVPDDPIDLDEEWDDGNWDIKSNF